MGFFIVTKGHCFSIFFREEGRDKNIDAKWYHLSVASHTCPDQGSCVSRQGSHVPMPGPGTKLQPSMCSDQELNLQPFGYGMTLQPTEPYWPGQLISFCQQLSLYELVQCLLSLYNKERALFHAILKAYYQ